MFKIKIISQIFFIKKIKILLCLIIFIIKIFKIYKNNLYIIY